VFNRSYEKTEAAVARAQKEGECVSLHDTFSCRSLPNSWHGKQCIFDTSPTCSDMQQLLMMCCGCIISIQGAPVHFLSSTGQHTALQLLSITRGCSHTRCSCTAC
jgi:hypothetical protein